MPFTASQDHSFAPHAYNSVWQMRSDTWCRLEEAAHALAESESGADREHRVSVVADLLRLLTPVEPSSPDPFSRCAGEGEHAQSATVTPSLRAPGEEAGSEGFPGH